MSKQSQTDPSTVRWGIKWKLMGLITVIMLCLVVVMSYTQISAQKRIMETELNIRIGLMKENLTERGRAFIITLSNQVENYIACLNFSGVIAAVNESVSGNEEINYGILMTSSGLVFSHTLRPDLVQSRLSGERDQKASLQKTLTQIPYTDNDEPLIEFVNPIQISTEPWGVLRLIYTLKPLNREIENSRKEIAHEIGKMVYRYLLTVAVFMVGCFVIVFFLSTRFSRPLTSLTESARRLSKGDFSVSSDIQVRTRDELGILGVAFIDMSTELKESYRKLSESENRFRALFEYAPISLWEEDLSRVKEHIEGLRDRGVADFRAYFDDYPEDITACADRHRIIDVNNSTLALYEAGSKEAVYTHIKQLLPREGREGLKEKLVALCEGRTFEREEVHKTVNKKEITVLIKAIIPPGSEETWSKVLVSVHDLTERVRADFLKKIFGRYLSEKVLETLIENPDAVKLGGEKRRVTIMITDLRGFTALSERLDPEQVVRILNTYFEVMADVVHQYNGTLNEIVGDSMLVIFGAPHKMPDRAQQAVACAIEMQNAMAKVNDINKSYGLPEIEMGIGINDAEVIVGNIGSKKRSKYGVVGSGVNITSRIESYSVGGQILISESMHKKAGENLRIDDQMEIRSKGSKIPLKLYEVGGIGGKYNVALEQRGTLNLLVLHREIPVCYSVLDGSKVVSKSEQQGEILRLSPRSAELRLQTELEPLTDLKLTLSEVSDTLSKKEFFGKIMKQAPGNKHICNLRFTSVPPEISAYFRAICWYGANRDG